MELGAKSAIIVEASTGISVFEKDADAKRFPASTTKIMTALLLLERTRPAEVIFAPKDVETVTGSSLHLKPFEAVTAHDLLFALIVRSANDGAYTIARHVSGSVEKFAELMNEKAKALGCTNTHFTNPHGLHDDLHYTTARDLIRIAREAWKRDEFRVAAGTTKYEVSRTLNLEDTVLISRNRALRSDPPSEGIKTGFTRPAGQCFVGSATHEGLQFLTVVLGSEDWYGDHQAMIEWAFANFELREVVKKGDAAASVRVQGGVEEQIELLYPESVKAPVPKGASLTELVASTVPQAIKAPIGKDQAVGTVRVTNGSGWSEELPLIAAHEVRQQFRIAGQSVETIGFALIAGGLGLGTLYVKNRARKLSRGFRGR
ncbi:hypothetical conserved protein [Candidatus Nitrosymbiomonas proteolyticus]|uniref:serine-type D-Ala-D-Ala carboxypeptidase n=1 Tax=Candidatus Nitrosymbiomonas proteolyticus TaxID=2608984 RepID=A0A809RAU7_9BACT|nr:hypothetical conserved protein [Candidatus Nitrosymbiomonas proteolyticus]